MQNVGSSKSRLPRSFLPKQSGRLPGSLSPALMLRSNTAEAGKFPESYFPELSSFYVKDVLEFANVKMMGACFFD